MMVNMRVHLVCCLYKTVYFSYDFSYCPLIVAKKYTFKSSNQLVSPFVFLLFSITQMIFEH